MWQVIEEILEVVRRLFEFTVGEYEHHRTLSNDLYTQIHSL